MKSIAMRAFQIVLLFMVCISGYISSYAQQRNCGYQAISHHLQQNNPNFKQFLDSIKYNKAHLAASKTAKQTSGTYTVPVVFHFVLTAAQQNFLGNQNGIAKRVNSQLAVLNEDFNAGNTDQSRIPDAFKNLLGNSNITFALAHTNPNGDSTAGWEVITTTHNGFDINADECSAAKHTNVGGADAWDVNTYLNIWVINILEGAIQSDVIGITVPPAFTDSTKFSNPYAKNEMGIVLSYEVIGRKQAANDSFLLNYNLGRTCTHEMGHYFGLFHTWGDDDSGGVCRCPWDSGGGDDGIADTPPEGCVHYGCYSFPFMDRCNSSDGIMYMNYMDYTDDSCMQMFTVEQVSRMDYNISVVGISHSLTSHPQVLDYPGNYSAHNDSYILYPNPAVSGRTAINFNQLPSGFTGFAVYDEFGKQIAVENTIDIASTYYPINLSAYGKGIYLLKLFFTNHVDCKKILVP